MYILLDWAMLLIVFVVVTSLTHVFTRNSRKRRNIVCKINNQLTQPLGALPFIGHLHLLGGQTTLARSLGAMADQCGPIFAIRLGQHQAVVMSSWEMVKDCFTKNDAVTATRPKMAISKYLFYDYAAFAISPSNRYWREIRKISTVELLSIKRLEKMKHVRILEVNSCLKNLHQECTKVIENNSKFHCAQISLGKWFESLTFNIALRMIVGKSYSPKSYDENGTFASRFKKAIGKATHISGIPVPSDFIPSLKWMDIMGYISSMKDTHKEIDMIIGHWLDEHIQRRKEGSSVENDFMDVLLTILAEGSELAGYSREIVIKATALTLLLTASESTSITLTWAISLLLNHPEALKSAQEELDLQVGRHRWVDESDVANLPYLQAIIKETIRLYPPSPLTGPRIATEDCYVDKHLIQEGTQLIVNIWKLHRDPRVWVEPNQFRPDRFLNENRNIDFRGQHFEYIPFSLGRRSCPGMNFGLQVVSLMLGRLVQGFDIWTKDGGPIDMSEEVGLALPKANPLDVGLEPRLPTNMYEIL